VAERRIMSDTSELMLVDPDEAVLRRVDGAEFEDGNDRIVLTWEQDIPEVGPVEFSVAVTPHYFARFVTAGAHAMGLPPGDTEYMAERMAKEIDAHRG